MSAFDERLCVTCSAPTNIATIKYWGKASAELNTPINSSVSVTLHQDDLKAITTVAASRSFSKDRLWLNGKEEDVESNKRLTTVIKLVRALAGDKVDAKTGEVLVYKADWPQYHVHIASRNTFPTAAGLASSAAGYACLTFALAQLFAACETYDGELTAIARQGSGSACRSLYGGFVRWQKGERADAADSIAVQVADEAHWPELRALIFVASAAKKGTSSTSGMGTSVATSELLRHRAAALVEPRLAAIEAAYLARDFAGFGRATMVDSNQFHATCLDTYPPIFYMNDVSRALVQAVHAFNAHHGAIRAAYTFDAGPNAVVYTTASDVAQLLAVMSRAFPVPRGAPACSDAALAAEAAAEDVPEALLAAVLGAVREPRAGDVQMVYATRVGDGPRVLGAADRMLDPATGLNTYAAPPPPLPSAAASASPHGGCLCPGHFSGGLSGMLECSFMRAALLMSAAAAVGVAAAARRRL
ncbi:Diphosphomevalonate decarboxylase [Tribonema minus]|uniref:diphosphomevalonate decarboxylase n=1 Tax=Tribonema minus TaxID=303371 RepID=A0A835YQZ6_9STRA|nr:Diphosphomevalonate decarboxylase [Tribonema minus]